MVICPSLWRIFSVKGWRCNIFQRLCHRKLIRGNDAYGNHSQRYDLWNGRLRLVVPYIQPWKWVGQEYKDGLFNTFTSYSIQHKEQPHLKHIYFFFNPCGFWPAQLSLSILSRKVFTECRCRRHVKPPTWRTSDLERCISRHKESPASEKTQANPSSGRWNYGREIAENFA